jgi:hypothetical protein
VNNLFRKLQIYIFNRIRLIAKSIGKKEENLINYITYLKWKKNKNSKNFFSKINVLDDLKKIKLPKFMIVTITFYFNPKKIKYLTKICEELLKISKNYKIVIITNLDPKKIKKNNILKKSSIEFYYVKNLTSNRFLTWKHLEIMRKYIKYKKFSHFLNIEDDILVRKENLIYWMKSRKFLKKFNLIPGFIRTEFNSKDKQRYLVDIPKIQKLKYLPKLYFKDKKNAFVNVSYPYHAMYLYDRNLMKEHLSGNSSNPDYGYGALDPNYINPKLINFDIMAKANVGLIYKNPPEGFTNRSVIPVDLEKKKIYECCLVKHLPNKYVKENRTKFGSIKLKDLLK